MVTCLYDHDLIILSCSYSITYTVYVHIHAGYVAVIVIQNSSIKQDHTAVLRGS